MTFEVITGAEKGGDLGVAVHGVNGVLLRKTPRLLAKDHAVALCVQLFNKEMKSQDVIDAHIFCDRDVTRTPRTH